MELQRLLKSNAKSHGMCVENIVIKEDRSYRFKIQEAQRNYREHININREVKKAKHLRE